MSKESQRQTQQELDKMRLWREADGRYAEKRVQYIVYFLIGLFALAALALIFDKAGLQVVAPPNV
jgi:hypothetical protein